MSFSCMCSYSVLLLCKNVHACSRNRFLVGCQFIRLGPSQFKGTIKEEERDDLRWFKSYTNMLFVNMGHGCTERKPTYNMKHINVEGTNKLWAVAPARLFMHAM